MVIYAIVLAILPLDPLLSDYDHNFVSEGLHPPGVNVIDSYNIFITIKGPFALLYFSFSLKSEIKKLNSLRDESSEESSG